MFEVIDKKAMFISFLLLFCGFILGAYAFFEGYGLFGMVIIFIFYLPSRIYRLRAYDRPADDG
jgi:hypothetical protein